MQGGIYDLINNIRLSAESEARVKAFVENNGTLYTLKETAAIIGRSPRTVMRYMQEGYIDGTLIHGRWCFTENAVKDFINQGS